MLLPQVSPPGFLAGQVPIFLGFRAGTCLFLGTARLCSFSGLVSNCSFEQVKLQPRIEWNSFSVLL